MRKTRPLSTLLRVLNIRPDEGKVVLLVLLYTVTVFTASTLFFTTAYALFLDQFDANRLPYVYIGVSICVPLITSLYLKLGDRFALSRLLLGSLALILLTILLYRMGLGLNSAQWLIFSLPIWNGVIDTMLTMSFWTLVGQLFDLQQGKRLFGLLSAGQPLGIIVTGFIVPSLVQWVGALNLLWVACVVGLLAWGLLLGITRRHAHALNRHSESDVGTDIRPVIGSASETKAQPSLWADPYVRIIFILQIVFATGVYAVDNIFYMRVESRFPDESQLASFLGIYNGIMGGVGLIYQAIVAGWLLRRFGVRAGILMTPVSIAIGVSIFAFIGFIAPFTLALFWIAVLTNIARQVLDASDDTVANLLYQVLPGPQRIKMQTAIDGVIYPISIGLAGALLLVLTNVLTFDSLQLAYLLLPVLFVWVWLGSRLARAYPKRVQQALRQRLLQGDRMLQLDRAGLSIIEQSLNNPHPGAAIYALNVLQTASPSDYAQRLPALLNHPNADVRQVVLNRIEQLNLVAALPAVQTRFAEDDVVAVRQTALRTLATLSPPERHTQFLPYLTGTRNSADGGDAQLRHNVMVGLLRNPQADEIPAIAHTLNQLAQSASEQDRIFAAQVLGDGGNAKHHAVLAQLLSDSSLVVRRAALQASAKLKHPTLWPRVIAQLGDPATRPHASQALITAGDAAQPDLEAGLAQTGLAESTHIELIRICGRIRSPSAQTLLLTQLPARTLVLRDHIYAALRQCGFSAHATQREQFIDYVHDELAHATWLLSAISVASGIAAHTDVVRHTLDAAVAQCRARVFLLLSFLYDAKGILNARDLLGYGPYTPHTGAEEQRAYALETIIVLVESTLKPAVLALIEDVAPSQALAQLSTRYPHAHPKLTPDAWYAALITAPATQAYPWTQAIVLQASQNVGASSSPPSDPLKSAFVAASHAPHWLVRETAQAQVQSPTPLRSIMLLTIEKVLILKTVDIFANTPDEVLVAIAALCKEINVEAGSTIFEKGQRGDSMYIIIEGEVEARDGERVFSRMGERQVFGEMALLDGEPRTATCRAAVASRLLRLEQEPFYELMDDRIEIARGIIHVLLQRLRHRTNDVNRLQMQLQALQPQSKPS